MFSYIKNALHPIDYNKLLNNLQMYDLDHNKINEWLNNLPNSKYKSRYILVSLVNKVKVQGEFIKKNYLKSNNVLEPLNGILNLIIDDSYNELNERLCRLYNNGCKLFSIYETIRNSGVNTCDKCLEIIKKLEKDFYGIML